MRKLDKITPQSENFHKWYIDVVKQGQLIAYGPIKGTIIFKNNAYVLWEKIRQTFDQILDKHHVKNVYLPLLIPLSYIEKEKAHIKGFKPELVTITQIGQKKLTMPLVIRPTSEVLFCQLFADEIDSYNNLPLLYNQWANVVRWEKTSNPFLRNREFLWQEGHTAHQNAIEAQKFTKKIINIYAKFLKNYLAIPVIIGEKTTTQKFAGAINTYTVEAMMKDGKALQLCTSHYLGQNFSKPFNVKFANLNNQQEFIYQTSWGMSTRLIGAIIMVHGDDRGIIMPPKIAPYQIDIIELFVKKYPKVHQKAQQIYQKLSSKWRVRLDDSDKNAGFKASQSEILGTPIRIEVGPRDLKQKQVQIVRRDTLEKIKVGFEEINQKVIFLLKQIHQNLLTRAQKHLAKKTIYLDSWTKMQQQFKNPKDLKFVVVPFAGNENAEAKIKQKTLATARCILSETKQRDFKKCIITSTKTKKYVVFAKEY